MENIVEFLKSTRLLGELSDDVIQNYIIPNGRFQDYQKENFLISEGETVNTVMIIVSGKVNVLYYYADGSYSLASTESPAHILALDLIATRTGISPYNAVAAEKTCVFSFPASIILQPGSFPEVERQKVLNQLLIMLSHFLMKKEKHLMVLSRNGLRERIMVYLSLQAQLKNSSSFTIPFSREEMAAYLCVNRSALSHELSLMKKEGIIDFSKNRFKLFRYDLSMSEDMRLHFSKCWNGW